MAKKDEKYSNKKILALFQAAYDNKRKWIDCALEDIKFGLGDQWDPDDVASLKEAGIRALTINKIRPNIFLLTGIESQNRTDWKGYPKGEEDGLKAEITSALLKNIADESDLEYVQSEQFEEALLAGECYIEPYLDYSKSIINAEIQFQKTSGTQIFPAPGCKKYDLSDAPYVFKLTQDLNKDQILELFPEKESKINSLTVTQMDLKTWNNLKTTPHQQKMDYGKNNGVDNGVIEETKYDLLEFYYKKYVRKPVVIDIKEKKVVNIEDEDKAIKFVEMANEKVPGSAELRYRMVPEIHLASLVGNDVIEDDVCWSYPRWESYPIIPLYAYKSTAPIENKEFLVQGIVRGSKDLNRDYNKRRTQELRILNSSANSGWQYEDGTLTEEQEKNYRKFGASPGINLVHKKGKAAPVKIVPTPLSQGHAQLAAERTQEMKESSGINSDMLAMQESQSSGRAIMLRQKQGLVMVQKLFDNNSRTKKMLARFILSQLPEVFDVESAMRVLGDKWVLANFGTPVMEMQTDPVTGQPIQMPVMNGDTPQLEMTPEAVKQASDSFNAVLNDVDLLKYDVSVGEGVYAETAKAGNYLEIMGMIEKGIPIPPDVLIDESSVNASSKDRIKKSLQARQAQPPA